MAIDAKMSLLSKTEKKLSTELTAFDMNRVLSIMADLMQEYEVKEKVCVADADDDLMECYFDAMSVRGFSTRTMKTYRIYLKDMMEYLKIPIRQIMVYHLRNYLSKKKEDGLMESTLSHRRSVMSSFFGWLHREGLIEKNPVSNLGTIKVPKKKKELYTDIDIAKLKDGCTKLRDKAIVYFLECSMCRISELVELNRNQIDYENRQFIVHGKGNKERMAFIDRVTAYLLKEYMESRTDDNEALFVNRYGDRISTDGIRFMINTLAKKVGVKHVHPHKFRRTSATNNARRGMPVQHIQFLLGHESIDTTMEYVQTMGEDAKLKYLQYVG